MHSTGLRALPALAVALGLGLGATTSFAQLFEGDALGEIGSCLFGRLATHRESLL